MVQVQWLGDMTFEATPPTGVKFTMDSHPDHGGQGRGPTPVEALLGSLAACSGIDVIDILRKKRQTVTAYRMEVEGERDPAGTYPRPFKIITVRHFVEGENLDPDAVARAVALSDEKYCTVISTLRYEVEVRSEWAIEAPKQ